MKPLPVDDVDMRILGEVFTGSVRHLNGRRERLEHIAKIVGIHRNTVFRRILRMKRHGCFFPVRGIINAHSIGGVLARTFYPLPPAQRTAALEARLFEELEALWCIARYDDGWDLMVAAPSWSEASATFRRASRLTGTPGQLLIRTDHDWPQTAPRTLDRTDMRILESVLDDGRIPFGRVARALGTSKRTVERRYAALVADDVVRMWPSAVPSMAGVALLYLHLRFHGPPAQREAAREALRQATPNSLGMDLQQGMGWFMLHSTSASQLLQQATQIATIPAVEVTLRQLCEGLRCTPHYNRLFRSLLQRVKAGTHEPIAA